MYISAPPLWDALIWALLGGWWVLSAVVSFVVGGGAVFVVGGAVFVGGDAVLLGGDTFPGPCFPIHPNPPQKYSHPSQ